MFNLHKDFLWQQAYGRELQEAHECCLKYRRTGKDAELTQVLTSFLTKINGKRDVV